MSKEQSQFVCGRCGLACGSWMDGWKHFAGGATQKSCGQKPQPVLRAKYEAAETAAVKAALNRP